MGRRGWATVLICSLFLGMILITSYINEDSSGPVASELDGEWEETLIDQKGAGDDKILLLHVDGIIADSIGFSSEFSASKLIDQLNQAISDQELDGVVMKVDSPGGTVVHSEQIHDKVVELKKSGKKVGVSMGATAASGGYYISAPADYIFANPSTLTGSIGVIFSLPNYKKAADWIGYTETNITSGKMKDIGNPLRDMTGDERTVFQNLVDESFEQFVSVIEKGRKLSKDHVLKVADGRIYSGRQAQKLKLVDRLGTLEDAISEMGNRLNSKDYNVVEYEEPFSWNSFLSSFVSQKQESTAEVIEKIFPQIHYEPRLLYLYQ